jgi:two-component system, NtrC family, nitrogen regulation sensor histidine kinase NtrY
MNNSHKTKKNIYFLLSALLFCLLAGLVSGYFYKNSPDNAVRVAEFEHHLNLKEVQAEGVLDKINSIIIHAPVDSLSHYPFKEDDISYYVYIKNNLVFWSDNQLESANISLPQSTNWQLIQLPNAICIGKTISLKKARILALIKIKNNYPYENDELVNSFASGFTLDKQIQILNGAKTDKYAVSDANDTYLFSFVEPKLPIFNEIWAMIGLIVYSLTFFLFFILYARTSVILRKKTISLTLFVIISASVGAIIGLMLYFNVPGLLFSNKLFTPFQYASNPILTSISHLTILTGFFISTICLFYFNTNIANLKSLTGRILIQFVSVLYFVLVYYIMSGLIYHSSLQISIFHFKDFSGLTIWIHALILVWGIGMALLFFKTHNFFKYKRLLRQSFRIDLILCVVLFIICLLVSPKDAIRLSVSFTILWLSFYLYFIFPKSKKIYGFIAIWVLLFSAFLVWNSLVINTNKKIDKYKILAQNIYINGSTDNDRIADILLEELDKKINFDRKIGRILIGKDSLSVANNYLNKRYLRGFWNKYEMKLNVAPNHSELYNEYDQFISKSGTQLKKTHFFSVPANDNNMSYIGKFQSNYNRWDSVFFFMEFYPRRNFKSYSFPNLLLPTSSDIQTKLNISIAKYDHQRLVYSAGKVEYSTESSWIPKTKYEFFSIIDNGRVQYIYAPNTNSYIVITEGELFDPISNVLYFVYTFLAFYAFCCLVLWGYYLSHRRWNYRLGLTTKFQYAFISLLIISFVGIFYVSVNFIQQKYQEQQIENLESKKNYIQKALQDMYYWNQDLNEQNSQALNFDLQDLSYIYHTDIHVYNNHGVLIGSSQPIIFNKNLISNRISPAPYFKSNSNINQYEHIGKLNYLDGYTDFYNGDYLQIGYIAIPQFFSQDEIKAEIESFISVIIHIYLIIIVLAILLSLFIGKQLSAPLSMLENKLKDMRLGRRNEKIDYSLNDEIGQLVKQYNRTVDQLDNSAKLLAKSERETAWKSMARQVAHEINNPLTPMKLTIQQLQRTKNMNDDRFDDYFVKSTAMLIEQIDNLSRIAGTFSDFARMPEANFERIDISARLYSVVQLFANNNEHVQIYYQGDENEAFVFADPEQMVQVFNNLLKNAIQSIPNDREGIIQISLNKSEKEINIEITDNGIGIESELSDKLFVPNFTTKSTGMGLGLAISKNIIELTGGKITFTTKVNEGTTFRVTLPVAD